MLLGVNRYRRFGHGAYRSFPEIAWARWPAVGYEDFQQKSLCISFCPSIKRAFIVSDAVHAAKGECRQGAVGTETRIISKEVYGYVEHTKLIPRYGNGTRLANHPCRFILKSREYNDFSNPGASAKNVVKPLANDESEKTLGGRVPHKVVRR
jgi:hypothetical protein